MILAAGLGTRLGAITRTTPKALVDIAGEPMLGRIIQKMQAAGVDELIINLHYRGDMIREYLNAKANFGMRVEFSEEPKILGTGGGIKNVQNFFSDAEPFLVHNCDVYSDMDLRALVAAHRHSGAVGTLAVVERVQQSYLVFGKSQRLIGWEMADGSKSDFASSEPDAWRYCFTGIQVLSPSIFTYMQDEPEEFSIVSTYVKAARAGQVIRPHLIGAADWVDIGTPEKLEELRTRLGAATKA